MMRKQAGITLMEVLVTTVLMGVIAGGLFQVFANTYSDRDFVVRQGTLETASRTPIDTLADHIRNAQQVHSVEPPTQVAHSSVLAEGTKTSVTYYKSGSSTDTVKYWLSGTELKRTADGSTVTVLSDVQELEFQYFKLPAGSNNYNNSSVVPTTDINGPTVAEGPLISQISIRAKVNVDGYLREMASLVRLRNSPYKVNL
jgi:type II secretory pathway component PulJ